MKIQRTASNIFDTIIDKAAVVAGGLLCVMMLLVGGAVISRYVFHLSQAWTIEFTGYCMFYLTFLGTAWLLKEKGHVKMDVLVAGKAPKTRAIIGIFTSVISLIIMGILVWSGINTIGICIEKGYTFGMGLKPPMPVILWIIPFGCLALLIQFAREIYEFVNLCRTGTLTVPEKQEISNKSG